jgi:hypothetical protein
VKSVIKVLLENNSFTILETDPTNSFQRNVRKKINYSKTLIRKGGKWKHYNQNATAQTIKGLLKLHKPINPIRPLVNWRNAPTYTLAKFLLYIPKSYAPHSYAFNVKNTKKNNYWKYKSHFNGELKFINVYTHLPHKN